MSRPAPTAWAAWIATEAGVSSRTTARAGGQPRWPRFVGARWWGGWGGPRVGNNVVISRTTIINVQNITTGRNATAPKAVVAVEHQRFGQGLITPQHVARVDIHALEPVRGRLDVK